MNVNMNGIEWAAGIFEGEGTVCAVKQARRRKDGTSLRSPMLRVKMANEQVVSCLMEIFGRGSIFTNQPKNLRWKRTWSWTVSGEIGVRDIYKQIAPYLSEIRLDQFDSVFQSCRDSVQHPSSRPKRWRT